MLPIIVLVLMGICGLLLEFLRYTIFVKTTLGVAILLAILLVIFIGMIIHTMVVK